MSVCMERGLFLSGFECECMMNEGSAERYSVVFDSGSSNV